MPNSESISTPAFGKSAPVIGIVGGIASGKSEVAKLLAQRGATVLDADKISRELLKESAVIEEIVGHFGRSVLDSNLQIDRTSLAALVFGNSDPQRSNRETLERILHPRVRTRLNAQVEASKSNPSTRLIVLDIPLLFEVGWNDVCQGVLFVDAPDSVRWARASHRGWTQENWQLRENSQLPLQEKRRRSTWVIQNDGDLDQLSKKVDEFLEAASFKL